MEFGRITFKQLKWASENANKAHGSDFFVVPSRLWKKRKYGICTKSATFAPPTFMGTAKECYMFLLGFDLGAYFIKDYDNIQKKFINKKQEGFPPETWTGKTIERMVDNG